MNRYGIGLLVVGAVLWSTAQARAQYNPYATPGPGNPYVTPGAGNPYGTPGQAYRPYWPRWPRPYPYPYPIYVPFPVDSNPYSPGTPPAGNGQPPAETPPADNRARIWIRLPSSVGDVWVGDEKMADKIDTERLFVSPQLEPGHNYSYTIRVRYVQRGRMVTDERFIRVRPNETTGIDFTRPAAKVSTPTP